MADPSKRPPKRSKLPRRLLTFLVLIALVGGGAYYFYAKAQKPEAPTYLSTTAKLGQVEETVLASGVLKPAKLVAVGAQVSGRVVSIPVEVGDQLSAGDLVAQIESQPQQNALRTAEAALRNAEALLQERQANLDYARTTVERQNRLLSNNATSSDAYEAAVETLNVTKAQIAALKAQIAEAEVAVENAKVDLGYTRITAPIDGTVLWIVTQEGQTVNAAQTAPTIVILGQLDVMTVRAEVSEVDIVKVEPGQRLWFTILGDPTTRYESTLQMIEPAPESITSDSAVSASSSASSASATNQAIYYNAVFDVPNEDRKLKTYMTAEVHIVVGDASEVVTIPSAALAKRNEDGSYLVRVVGPDGTLKDRRVEIGLNDGITAEVRSGLEAGDEVAMSGADSASYMRNRRSPLGF